jgi:hypothetical protein
LVQFTNRLRKTSKYPSKTKNILAEACGSRTHHSAREEPNHRL